MTTAKVLPCGHYFHYHCLRSWLEQSSSCPVCRASLMDPVPPAEGGHGPAQAESANGGGGSNATARDGRMVRRRRRPAPLRAGAIGGAGGGGDTGAVDPGLADRVGGSSSSAHGAHRGPHDERYTEGGTASPPSLETLRTRLMTAIDREPPRMSDDVTRAAERALERDRTNGRALEGARERLSEARRWAAAARELEASAAAQVATEEVLGAEDTRAGSGPTPSRDAPTALYSMHPPSLSALMTPPTSSSSPSTSVLLQQSAPPPGPAWLHQPPTGPTVGPTVETHDVGGGRMEVGVQVGGALALGADGLSTAAATASLPLDDDPYLDGFDGEGEGEEYSDYGEEGEEEGEEEEEVQSYLLFSSENWRWPSWLPRLHLEVIQRRGWDEGAGANTNGRGGGGGGSAGQLTTQEELAQLREVFPQVTEGELRRVLLASPSLEAAIEQLLSH